MSKLSVAAQTCLDVTAVLTCDAIGTYSYRFTGLTRNLIDQVLGFGDSNHQLHLVHLLRDRHFTLSFSSLGRLSPYWN